MLIFTYILIGLSSLSLVLNLISRDIFSLYTLILEYISIIIFLVIIIRSAVLARIGKREFLKNKLSELRKKLSDEG